MAKCHKCAARKGKRYCPALDSELCPSCCAEGRLISIACPHDCVYLEGEKYQHERRKERAASRGKAFVDFTKALVPEQTGADFAFKLQADIYYFLRRRARADDAAIAKCLEAVKGLLSPIVIPEAAPHPLTRFLLERLADTTRYPSETGPGGEERLRILRDLARRVSSLGGEGDFRYADLLASFFDALDFEADLDYSPDDARAAEPAQQEAPRSPGGLILPFSQDR